MVLLKVKVVLWKNLKIRKRHWFITLCEVSIPVTLFFVLAYARSQMNTAVKKYQPDPTYTEPVALLPFNPDIKYLFYAPKNNFTSEIIERTRMKLSIYYEGVQGFISADDLLGKYNKIDQDDSVMAVIFHAVPPNSYPKNLIYDIRCHEKSVWWNTENLFYSDEQYISQRGSENYLNHGFMALKVALDTSFLEMAVKSRNLPDFKFQEFPYPPHTSDPFILMLFTEILPFITVFSFIFLCPAVLKRIVEEKYSGIKELMKMVGLQSWMSWLGWFIHAFLVNLFSIVVIVFLMKYSLWNALYPPIEYCDFSVLGVLLLLYCAASITFCFAISALFDRPTVAMIAGLLIWILSYFIPINIVSQNMNWCKKILFAIFPNVAVYYGYNAIYMYEIREIGVKWENIRSNPTGGSNDVTMANVFAILLFDFIFYGCLAFYIDKIKPGPYGIPKSPFFPISDLLSKLKRSKVQVANNDVKNGVFEETPLNLQTGIEIRNLYKRYGNVEAVKGISLNIYKDQITVLLGINGAGKSTTMSMITGMLKATSGSVFINGYDVRRNIGELSKSLGLCPQHNLLFIDLNVMEHLLFFAMLKGLSLSKAKTEAIALLHKLNMYDKRSSMPNTLSGGMKRKLCLGMAIIGNSEVLILDEPTSGMDPEARRAIWDLLLSFRDSRTILITTHFMEEADVLGDRIAIMSEGEVICYGTPIYLKNELGNGYNLTIVRDVHLYKEQTGVIDEDKNLQLNSISNIIRKLISGATLKTNSGNILTFLLPMESKPLFHEMLHNLENNKAKLGIENISISITTLEDVFLRVSNQRYLRNPSVLSNGSQSNISVQKTEGTQLIVEKLQALIKKRLIVFHKKLPIHMIQFFTALLIAILTIYLGGGGSSSSSLEEKRLNFDLSIYGKTSVYYTSDASDAYSLSVEKFYKSVVEEQGGIPIKTNNITEAIINKGIDNLPYYKKHMVVAAEFENGSVNILYSNPAIHGAPVSFSLIMNAILKATTQDNEYSIFSANVPLPVQDKLYQQFSQIQIMLLWLVLFPIGILFIMGGFIIFPQLERVSNIVQLQFMCGIRSYLYWLTTFLTDLALYTLMITSLCFLFQLAAEILPGSSDIFNGLGEVEILLFILFVYAIPALPYTYLFSYKRSVAGGFAAFLISGLFIGVILTVIVNLLLYSGDNYYESLGNDLRYVFLLYPQFGLTFTLVKFSLKAVDNYNWRTMTDRERTLKCRFDYNACCSDDAQACSLHKSYIEGNNQAIGSDLLVMATSAVIYFSILLVLDADIIAAIKDKVLIMCDNFNNKNKQTVTEVDSFGSQAYDTTPSVLEANDLEKIYGARKVVRGVSFNVKAGDCFGLLGVNGAGKTTTFKMLTGDESLTRGTANIRENISSVIDITKNPTEYLKRMGYCPQFDAINHVLTGRQTLTTFAMFRGIPKPQIDQEVNNLLDTLCLTEFADKPCGEYSGGNKRRLSIALALIGQPSLILLDEPTSGVDPAGRRALWDIISCIKENNANTSVILTSHSMEECEALCNTLAIMKNGRIYCRGTIPQLKEKFGKGYTVLLKLKYLAHNSSTSVPIDDDFNRLEMVESCASEVKNVMNAMTELYGDNCCLRDKHKGLLHYYIKDNQKRWSNLFRDIEAVKVSNPVIEDYSISDTSLEDVFLEIARRS